MNLKEILTWVKVRTPSCKKKTLYYHWYKAFDHMLCIKFQVAATGIYQFRFSLLYVLFR